MQTLVLRLHQPPTVQVGYQVVILMEKITVQLEIAIHTMEHNQLVGRSQLQNHPASHKLAGKLLILMVPPLNVYQKPVLKLLILSKLTQSVMHFSLDVLLMEQDA